MRTAAWSRCAKTLPINCSQNEGNAECPQWANPPHPSPTLAYGRISPRPDIDARSRRYQYSQKGELGLKHAFIVALAASVAPMAHAQQICINVNKITSAASDDFKPIWGEQDEDDYVPTSVWLEDGAVYCGIDLREKAYYSCIWNLKTQTQAEAEYESLLAAVRPCLAGWSEADAVSKKTFGGMLMIKGLNFGSGPGKDAGTVVTVYFKGSDDRYSLGFEVGRR